MSLWVDSPRCSLAVKKFTPDATLFRWLAIYPARQAFELGTIASGMFLGLGLCAAIYWDNTTWTLAGLGYAIITLTLVVGFAKIYSFAINPPANLFPRPIACRIVILLLVLATALSSFWTYFS